MELHRRWGRLLERIDNERLAVAAELGWQLERTEDWLRRSYGVQGGTLFEAIQQNRAYETIEAPHRTCSTATFWKMCPTASYLGRGGGQSTGGAAHAGYGLDH